MERKRPNECVFGAYDPHFGGTLCVSVIAITKPKRNASVRYISSLLFISFKKYAYVCASN